MRRMSQSISQPHEGIVAEARSETPSAPDTAEVAEEATRAREAIRKLRPEQQRVLELSVEKGMTHEQISRTTGMPLGTVKTHARRGLIRVRELLAEVGLFDEQVRRVVVNGKRGRLDQRLRRNDVVEVYG